MALTIDEYWIWLVHINGMWQQKIDNLIRTFGSVEEIYYSSEKKLKASKVLKEEDVSNIINSRMIFDPKEKLYELDKKNIKFIHIDKKEYPEKLKNLPDKPYALFVKGHLPKNEHAVSIVGARACSNYGREMARKFGGELAESRVDVISGMARGIDTYAHLGALEVDKPTYAVLGCGVDVCYPTENIELYEQIMNKGGIISEYICNTKPLAWQFPMRNRIISGLSNSTIIIEAKEKSGSLITATYALEQGKDIFALPGRLDDVLSAGCNKLIKEGAFILTKSQDVLFELGISDEMYVKKNKNFYNLLEKDFEVVYSNVDLIPASVEEIVLKSELEYGRVYEILLKLQLENIIFEPIKNYFARKS